LGRFPPIATNIGLFDRLFRLRRLLHSMAAFGIALPVAGDYSPAISRMRV